MRYAGGSKTPTKRGSTHSLNGESSLEQSKDSPLLEVDGASTSNTATKLTYESIFYRKMKSRKGGERIYGFPMCKGQWCNSDLKRAAMRKSRVLQTDSDSIARENSRKTLWVPCVNQERELVYGTQDQGFPKAPYRRGPIKILWCNTWVLRLMNLRDLSV